MPTQKPRQGWPAMPTGDLIAQCVRPWLLLPELVWELLRYWGRYRSPNIPLLMFPLVVDMRRKGGPLCWVVDGHNIMVSRIERDGLHVSANVTVAHPIRPKSLGTRWARIYFKRHEMKPHPEDPNRMAIWKRHYGVRAFTRDCAFLFQPEYEAIHAARRSFSEASDLEELEEALGLMAGTKLDPRMPKLNQYVRVILGFTESSLDSDAFPTTTPEEFVFVI